MTRIFKVYGTDADGVSKLIQRLHKLTLKPANGDVREVYWKISQYDNMFMWQSRCEKPTRVILIFNPFANWKWRPVTIQGHSELFRVLRRHNFVKVGKSDSRSCLLHLLSRDHWFYLSLSHERQEQRFHTWRGPTEMIKKPEEDTMESLSRKRTTRDGQ